MTARACRACAPAGSVRSSTKIAFRIGASGLRSSCDSIPRNSVFRRSASRSASSASLRAVMSIAAPMKRATRPSAPRIGASRERNHRKRPSALR